MTNLLLTDEKRIDPNGYDAALRALNTYFGADEQAESLEDLKMLDLLWDAKKCACGECSDCWMFSPHRGVMGPLGFWVHGEHVEQYSVNAGTIFAAHDAVMA